MNAVKPEVSANSRVHNASHYSRRGGAAQRPVENTKGKMPTGRNVGKLMKVMNMPLDVFFEITSHLQPLDLLQLSRASNELRSMLMSRTSRHMWVAARKNVDPPLPNCATYLSEPMYAHILFERICSACGVGRAHFAEFIVPARFCGPCLKTNIKKGTQIIRELRIPKDHVPELVNMLPSEISYAFYRSKNWEPYTELRQDKDQHFYKAKFGAVADQYRRLRARNDGQALRRFIEECKTDALERYNFHAAITVWEGNTQERKAKENDTASDERRADIYTKLRELGYERHEFPIYDQAWLGLVNQPRKLTTRIWNTIRPKLVEILDAGRRSREQAAFERKWRVRLLQLKAHYTALLQKDRDVDPRKRTLPCFGHVIELDFVKSLLTSKEPGEDLLREDFQTVEEAILAHGDEFKTRAQQELASRLRDKLSASSQTPSTTAAPTGKGKSNAKGKKKAPAADDVAAGDVAAGDVCALLEQPEALFGCFCGWRPILFSWAGLLEHRQTDHEYGPFNASDITVDDENAGFVKSLLGALGLPGSAGLSEVENLAASGEPVCTCWREFEDSNSYPLVEPYHRLYRLLRHVMFPPRDSQVRRTPETAVHRITFKPITNEASQEAAAHT